MPLRTARVWGVFALAAAALSACGDEHAAPAVAAGSAAGGAASGGSSALVGGAGAGTSIAGTSAGNAGSESPTGGASGAPANPALGGSAGSAGSAASAGSGSGGSGARDYSSDRALFFGESRCAGAGLRFCEDFESGTLDAATWQTSGSAPVIDELKAARGKKALHFSLSGNGSTRVTETKSFPAKAGRYWGRAFVYFNAMPHSSDQPDSLSYSHWTVIAATGAMVAGEVRIGGQLQKRFQNPGPLNFWGVGTDNRNEPEGSGDWTNADGDPQGAVQAVAEKQWSCVEWLGDYTTDETKFFLDGVEHPSLGTTPATAHGGNPDKPFYLPAFSAIWFGWAEYQATSQSFELWFDEIALDDERIGCVL